MAATVGDASTRVAEVALNVAADVVRPAAERLGLTDKHSGEQKGDTGERGGAGNKCSRQIWTCFPVAHARPPFGHLLRAARLTRVL